MVDPNARSGDCCAGAPEVPGIPVLGSKALPPRRILAEPPLRWISPGILRPGDIAPARNRLLLWTDTLVRIPRIVVRQDGNVIARKSLPWPASPGRVFRVPASVLDKVNAHGGPVTLSLGINGGSKHRPTKD